MLTVSVQIVTYNSMEYVDECLNAVFGQTHPLDKVIIIDNASSDGTAEHLRVYENKAIIICNNYNNGFAGAHNQAIQISDSDLVLVLNPDVRLDQEYIRHLVQVFNTDSKIGSVTGKLLLSDRPDIVDSTGLKITKSRRAFDRGTGDPSNRWNHSGYVFGVSGAAALYKRAMITDISLGKDFFDADFFVYKEDVDVAWRAQLYGWKSFYEPRSLGYHHRGWRQNSRSKQSLVIRRYSYINRYKMVIKNDKLLNILRHIIPIILYEVGSFLYFLFKEPRVLTSWGNLIKELPSVLSKKKSIKIHRRVSNKEINVFFE